MEVARLRAEFHVGVVEEFAALEIAVGGAVEPGVLVDARAVDRVIKSLSDPSIPPQRVTSESRLIFAVISNNASFRTDWKGLNCRRKINGKTVQS